MTDVRKTVDTLVPGDLVDAESFASWLAPEDMITAEYEYWRVESVTPETDRCTLVVFDQASYGLPPGLAVLTTGNVR